MLFLSKSAREQLLSLARERLAGTIGEEELGKRVLEIDPESGAGRVALGGVRFAAGDLDEAESLFWQALERKPCGYQVYMALSDVRRKRDPGDLLSIRLRELGLWKLSVAEDIPDEVANSLRSDSSTLDFKNPETYGLLAEGYEEEHQDLAEPPEVSDRLLPYRLLNDLQLQADEEVEESLMRDILAERERCVPIFRGALHEWARNPPAVSTETIALILALMGEIGGPDVLDDLLELAVFGDEEVFLHTHWAAWRIGQRRPVEALEKFRAATPSASPGLRCALAEQINLLPEVPGATPAVVDLLKGFADFASGPDGAYLLMMVVYCLIEFHRETESLQIAERYRAMLSKRGRHQLDSWLDPDGEEFVPKLVYHEINRVDIEDICVGRALMVDEESEDSDEEGGKEGHWDADWDEEDSDEAEPAGAATAPAIAKVKPGRNEPCWCGSGKKYKKCHLDADEEAERSRR